MAYVIDDAKKEGVFKDATLAYVSVKKPEKTNKPEDKPRFSVAAVVPVEDGKEHKKRFPKSSVNYLDSDEIRRTLKVEPPTDAPMHAVVKVRAKATVMKDNPEKNLKAGDPVPYDWPTRPKLYIPEDVPVFDEATQETVTRKKGVDRTTTAFVPNGSKGNVKFAIRSDAYGQTPDLRAILVTDLLPSGPREDLLGVELEYSKPKQSAQPVQNESPRHEQREERSPSTHTEPAVSAPKTYAVDDDGFPSI